jgi:adenosylmethionine-8-amino-7-oxononanoate aminotransferase
MNAPVTRSRVLHRSSRTAPPLAVGGHGVWLVEQGGREVLDASGGAAVSCLGHQHPRIVEAIKRQADRLCYAHTGFFSNEPAEALAEELVGHEPGGLVQAYFVSGGSEAMEAAVKLARQYFVEIGQPRRSRYIARRQSYHGNTLGALAAGGNAGRRAPYAPLLTDAFSHVSPAFAYREQQQGEDEADSPPASPPNWKPSSSASARERRRLRRRDGGGRHLRLRPRPAPAISRRCARSATATARC